MPIAKQWIAEETYQSAQRKAKTGYSVIRDGRGEFVGELQTEKANRIVQALNLIEDLAAFWADYPQSAFPLSPGAFITERDVPIAQLIREAAGWRKP